MAKRLSINLKTYRKNKKVIVVLRGTLDGSSAYEAKNALKRIENGAKDSMLVLDFSSIRKLEYFSIGILSKAIKSCRRKFSEIRLVGLGASTLNEFKRFGVESIFNNTSFASS